MAEVFLSHNRLDKPFVRELMQELENLGVTDIFLDEISLDGGERLIPGLERGIEDTLLFIMIWSKNAAQSKWVPLEREKAIIQNVYGTTRRVLPICLDDTELPGFMQLYVGLAARTAAKPEGLSAAELAKRVLKSLENARKERKS